MVGMKTHRVIGQIQGLLDHGAYGHLTDAQLLELFRGECDAGTAFETLVLRHGPAVLRACRRILGSRGEADDAFQATFLVLARRARSLHPQGSLGPWLQGVARRIAMKARTAAIRRSFHERQSAVADLFEPDTRAEITETLREEVDRLPEHLRAPTVLCYFEGMSYKSAAVAIGISEAAVRGRLSKARDVLKLRLSRKLHGSPIPQTDRRSGSLAHGVPLGLLDATTRAARVLASRSSEETKIAPSVLRMVEGALKMMIVSRMIRALAVVLLVTAGTALAGLNTNGVWPAEGIEPMQRHDAATPNVLVSKSDITHDISIQATSIRTKPENAQVFVDGPGTLSLWVDRGFLARKIEEPAPDSRGEMTLLKISWTGRMQLVGRKNGNDGRATAHAEFHGNVVAQIDDGSIRCEEWMRASMTRPVPLERIQIVLKGRASDTLLRRPQTTIARVEAHRNVVVQGNMIDPDKRAFMPQQRIRCDSGMIYDSRTGEFQVSGKGELLLEKVSPATEPRAKNEAAGAGPVTIGFGEGMTVRTGPTQNGDAPAQVVQFFGGVTIPLPPTEGAKNQVKPERNSRSEGRLTAQSLRLSIGQTQVGGESVWLTWMAVGDVEVNSGNTRMYMQNLGTVLPVD